MYLILNKKGVLDYNFAENEIDNIQNLNVLFGFSRMMYSKVLPT